MDGCADILSRFSSESSEMPELDPDGRTFQGERRVPPLNVTCRPSTKRTYKITQVASTFLLSFFFSPFSFGTRYGSAIKEAQVIAQFLKYEKMMPAYVCRVPEMTVAVISIHCSIHLNMALAEAASLAQGSLLLSPDLHH